MAEPPLWTDVHVYGTSELYFSTFLERSGSCLVDLTIVTVGDRSCTAIAQLVEQRVQSSSCSSASDDFARIRNLNLFVDNQMHSRQLLRPLEEHPLPNLRSLQIHSSMINSSAGWYLTPPQILPKVQSLDSIHLTGLAVSHEIRAMQSNLTTLILHDILDFFEEYFLGILFERSPHLSTLVLGNLNLDPPDWLDHPHAGLTGTVENVVVAPALKHLAIASPVFSKWRKRARNGPCATGCRCALRNLSAERLEYLEVTGEDLDGLYHLIPVLRRRIEGSTTNGQTDHSLGVARGPLPLTTPPLTLVLNGLHVQPSHFQEKVTEYIPQTFNTRLHFYPTTTHVSDESASVSESLMNHWSSTSEQMFLKLFESYKSAVVHFSSNVVENVPTCFRRIPLDPSRGAMKLQPVLLYPRAIPSSRSGKGHTQEENPEVLWTGTFPTDAPYLEQQAVAAIQARQHAVSIAEEMQRASNLPRHPEDPNADDEESYDCPYTIDMSRHSETPELDDSLELASLNLDDVDEYREACEHQGDFEEDVELDEFTIEDEMFSDEEAEFGQSFV